MNDYLTKPAHLQVLAAALGRRWTPGPKTDPLENEDSFANGALESALCEETLQGLKQLGATVRENFFPELLETYERDVACHLGELRTAIAGGDPIRLRAAAHALKGGSRTVGALVMGGISQQLEDLGIAQSTEGAAEVLVRLEREFERVKNQIRAIEELLANEKSPK